MTKETIDLIGGYLNDHKDLNNSQIAKLILTEGKSTLAEESLKKYVGQVRKLKEEEPNKIVDTTNEVAILNTEESSDLKESENSTGELTIHQHIKGYLIAYPESNNTELVKIMKNNQIGLNYSDGTLKNYIARNRKDVDTNSDSAHKSLSISNKKEEEKISSISNHEVLVVDESTIGSQEINEYVRSLNNFNIDSKITIVSFSENINLIAAYESCKKYPYYGINSEKELGINLLNAINLAVTSALKHPKEDNVNLTIITSGFDNLSDFITYNDIRHSIDTLKSNYGWNVNLVFAGQRKEEATDLAIQLGVDTSNLFVNTGAYNICNAMINASDKRLRELKNGEKVLVNYYK